MNEGHAALLTLALLESQLGGGPLGAATEADIEQVRRKCVFTTHTPVPAGHDRFSTEQAIRILGGDRTARLEKLGCFHDGLLNMTLLALRFSRYANGVAMQHGKVSREMFPEFHDRLHHQRRSRAHLDVGTRFSRCSTSTFPPGAATISTCATPSICPKQKIQTAHARAKEALLAEVATRTGLVLNPKRAHAGLCPPRRHLQARQPAVHRSRTAAEDRHRCRRHADSLRRQGSSPGRARQSADPGGL